MGRLTLFWVCSVVLIGLTLGFGVLPEDSINAAVGSSVTFTTSQAAVQTHLESVFWQFGGDKIVSSVYDRVSTSPTYKDRVNLSTLTGYLELKNVGLSDKGLYLVTIQPTADTTTEGNTTLNVYAPVSNVEVTTETGTDLEEFDSVSLSCSALSGTDLSFRWFSGSAEVTAGDRVQIADGGATLTINPVLRNDQNSYSCEAYNPVSSTNSSNIINISVSYGPENVILTHPPLDDYYEGGSVISLNCSADSRPDAEFKWLIDGETLTSFAGPQINLVLEQSGNYSCRAFNRKTGNSTDSQTLELLVRERINNAVITSSTDHPVEGKSMDLICEATGFEPVRQWTFNDTALQPSGNIVFSDNNRVLSFKKLTREDNGKYTCRISNAFSSQSADYLMNVIYGPDSIQVPEDVKIYGGDTLKLKCLAYPAASVKYNWTKDGKYIVGGSGAHLEYTKNTGTFSTSDSGNYTCAAYNDVTSKVLEASSQVTVSVNPGIIVGIVIACIVAVLLILGGVFFGLKKKNLKLKSKTRTDGEGQDNSAFTPNQEPNYADVRFVKKDGEVVQLGVQNNNSEYSEVKRNNNPAASRLPSYNAHMQRGKRAAPERPSEYAEVRPKPAPERPTEYAEVRPTITPRPTTEYSEVRPK